MKVCLVCNEPDQKLLKTCCNVDNRLCESCAFRDLAEKDDTYHSFFLRCPFCKKDDAHRVQGIQEAKAMEAQLIKEAFSYHNVEDLLQKAKQAKSKKLLAEYTIYRNRKTSEFSKKLHILIYSKYEHVHDIDKTHDKYWLEMDQVTKWLSLYLARLHAKHKRFLNDPAFQTLSEDDRKRTELPLGPLEKIYFEYDPEDAVPVRAESTIVSSGTSEESDIDDDRATKKPRIEVSLNKPDEVCSSRVSHKYNHNSSEPSAVPAVCAPVPAPVPVLGAESDPVLSRGECSQRGVVASSGLSSSRTTRPVLVPPVHAASPSAKLSNMQSSVSFGAVAVNADAQGRAGNAVGLTSNPVVSADSHTKEVEKKAEYKRIARRKRSPSPPSTEPQLDAEPEPKISSSQRGPKSSKSTPYQSGPPSMTSSTSSSKEDKQKLDRRSGDQTTPLSAQPKIAGLSLFPVATTPLVYPRQRPMRAPIPPPPPPPAVVPSIVPPRQPPMRAPIPPPPPPPAVVPSIVPPRQPPMRAPIPPPPPPPAVVPSMVAPPPVNAASQQLHVPLFAEVTGVCFTKILPCQPSGTIPLRCRASKPEMRGAFPSVLRSEPQPRPSRSEVDELRASLVQGIEQKPVASSAPSTQTSLVPNRPGGVSGQSSEGESRSRVGEGLHRSAVGAASVEELGGRRTVDPPNPLLNPLYTGPAAAVKTERIQLATLDANARLMALLETSSENVRSRMGELTGTAFKAIATNSTTSSSTVQPLGFLSTSSFQSTDDILASISSSAPSTRAPSAGVGTSNLPFRPLSSQINFSVKSTSGSTSPEARKLSGDSAVEQKPVASSAPSTQTSLVPNWRGGVRGQPLEGESRSRVGEGLHRSPVGVASVQELGGRRTVDPPNPLPNTLLNTLPSEPAAVDKFTKRRLAMSELNAKLLTLVGDSSEKAKSQMGELTRTTSSLSSSLFSGPGSATATAKNADTSTSLSSSLFSGPESASATAKSADTSTSLSSSLFSGPGSASSTAKSADTSTSLSSSLFSGPGSASATAKSADTSIWSAALSSVDDARSTQPFVFEGDMMTASSSTRGSEDLTEAQSSGIFGKSISFRMSTKKSLAERNVRTLNFRGSSSVPPAPAPSAALSSNIEVEVECTGDSSTGRDSVASDSRDEKLCVVGVASVEELGGRRTVDPPNPLPNPLYTEPAAAVKTERIQLATLDVNARLLELLGSSSKNVVIRMSELMGKPSFPASSLLSSITESAATSMSSADTSTVSTAQISVALITDESQARRNVMLMEKKSRLEQEKTAEEDRIRRKRARRR